MKVLYGPAAVIAEDCHYATDCIGKASAPYLRKSEDLHKSSMWNEDSYNQRIVSCGKNGLPRQFFCLHLEKTRRRR